MSPRLTLPALALLTLASCDRSPDTTPTTAPTADSPLDDKNFGARPLSVGDTPDTPSVANPNTDTSPLQITIGGRQIPFPPGRLTLSRDGTAYLRLESDTAPNTLLLLMTPSTDGQRPWRTATWTYELTTRDDQTTDGLYIGGPDHQLRPVRLKVDITRATPSEAAILLTGWFVPAESDDPLTAPGYEVEANFTLPLEGP